MVRNLPAAFIAISVVYFLIGAFWMGFGEFIPEPRQAVAQEPYMWAKVHLMLLGWATFAIFGALYYLVPRIAGRDEMHSSRLGRIHFWLTNITFPIAMVLLVYASSVFESLLESGTPESQVHTAPTVLPLTLAYIVVLSIGFSAQFLFAYNIYRTLRFSAPQAAPIPSGRSAAPALIEQTPIRRDSP